jgi:hypothetical protein
MSVEKILLDSQAAAAAIAASRLLSCGSAREQRATFSFLLVNAAGCFILSLFHLRSDQYFWWYVACAALNDVAAILALRELFGISVAEYPGIRTAVQRSIYAWLAVSVLVSAGLSYMTWQSGPKGWTNLYYILNLHRSLQFSFTAIVISLIVFLSRYPLELRRNIYVSGYLFSVVFLTDAADTMIATLTPKLYDFRVDMAGVAFLGICFSMWAVMVRKEGIAPRRIVFRTPKDAELLRQLESLNQTLSRIGRH